MWNRERTAHTAAKGVKPLRSLLRKVINVCIQRIILEILEQTSMKLIGSGLGREGHVSDLRKFGVVVKSRNFELSDALGRGIRIGPGGIHAECHPALKN